VLQGLTLKPLMRALKLHDGDPVAGEVSGARAQLMAAAFSRLPPGDSAAVELVRKTFKIRLGDAVLAGTAGARFGSEYEAAYTAALDAARQKLLGLRDSGEIGDDAFHALENDLDWMELSDPVRTANVPSE
jgi:monovalent cation/hydrogen antiporter